MIRSGWCQGADGRDVSGKAVPASDPTAVAWSLPGAFAAVSDRPDFNLTALRDALWGVSGVIPDDSLEAWNDAPGRTQTETLEMLNRASTNLNQDPPPSTPSQAT